MKETDTKIGSGSGDSPIGGGSSDKEIKPSV